MTNNQRSVGCSVVHYGLLMLVTIMMLCEIRADRTYSKIYEPIEGALACFRRYNGTRQVGCASKSLNGDTGVLHLVEDKSSLEWVIKDGPHAPYIVVLYPRDFKPEYMSKFRGNDRIAGVLVLEETSSTRPKTDSFSSELTCPNKGFGLYNQSSKNYCPTWNPPGTGILYEDWDFPIFFVHVAKEAHFIIKCFEDFNSPVEGVARDWPLCAAQLQSFMLGAVDTPTCLRRSKVFSINPGSSTVCDPLGDLNLHTSLVGRNQMTPYKNKSVIVIAARLDSVSMFDKIAPGADSAATGIVTFLAILKHLSSVKDIILNSTNSDVDNIYFILFNGEAFDYIGSSRIVYDMMNNSFPYKISDDNSTEESALLKLKDIQYFIEIGQVGLKAESDSYFVHQYHGAPPDVKSKTGDLIDKLIAEGKEPLTKLAIVSVQDHSKGIPPSSFQSFLKVQPDIPGLLIANHDETAFKNPFYNGVLDTGENLGYDYKNLTTLQKRIATLAAVVANTVTNLTGVNVTKFEPDVNITNELLHCYIQSAKCKLFQNITTASDDLEPFTYSLYVGVRGRRSANPITTLTRKLMVYFQGTNINKTEGECGGKDKLPNFNYYWINGSCFETTVTSTEAVSPAFLINDYDWTSGQYSTWSESIWKKLAVRVFVKPSLQHELLTLCFGIAVFVVSFIVVGYANRKSDIIFSSSSSAEAIIC